MPLEIGCSFHSFSSLHRIFQLCAEVAEASPQREALASPSAPFALAAAACCCCWGFRKRLKMEMRWSQSPREAASSSAVFPSSCRFAFVSAPAARRASTTDASLFSTAAKRGVQPALSRRFRSTFLHRVRASTASLWPCAHARWRAPFCPSFGCVRIFTAAPFSRRASKTSIFSFTIATIRGVRSFFPFALMSAPAPIRKSTVSTDPDSTAK
mmetsp:Transcript_26977/g.52938  ORF Transcript_26977/g.52938 Transcript_26977/m.52938 type:complete len:212 (-) Transcript_26977:419-1054(-)